MTFNDKIQYFIIPIYKLCFNGLVQKKSDKIPGKTKVSKRHKRTKVLTRNGTGLPHAMFISSRLIYNPGSSCMPTVITNKYLWRKNCNLWCSRVAFANSNSISINKERFSYHSLFIVIFSLGEICLHYCRNIYGHEINDVIYWEVQLASFHGESVILKTIMHSSEHAKALKKMQILSAYIWTTKQ